MTTRNGFQANGKTYVYAGTGMPSDLLRVIADATDRILEAEKALNGYNIDSVWLDTPVIMYDDEPIAFLEIEDGWANVMFLKETKEVLKEKLGES